MNFILDEKYYWKKNQDLSRSIQCCSIASLSGVGIYELIFVEGRKPEYPEKNPRSTGENPGLIGERQQIFTRTSHF